jgi:hypothetical protein
MDQEQIFGMLQKLENIEARKKEDGMGLAK